MPDFGTPFSVLAQKQPVTHEELIRAVRLMVAAEYEAVQLYTELAESTYNTLAIDVLRVLPMKKEVMPANC
jgi:rubrerythrin